MEMEWMDRNEEGERNWSNGNENIFCCLIATKKIELGDILYMDYGKEYSEISKYFLYLRSIYDVWPSLMQDESSFPISVDIPVP